MKPGGGAGVWLGREKVIGTLLEIPVGFAQGEDHKTFCGETKKARGNVIYLEFEKGSGHRTGSHPY